MALDLKIEVFAYELFDELWHDNDWISVNSELSFTYAEEYIKDPDYDKHCSLHYSKAVLCRICLFTKIYSQKVRKNISKILSSKTDFYEYFLSVCHDTDLFEGLTIFERVFATCAFVTIMCLECFYLGFKEFAESAYLCWAMYFDRYSTEFYAEGGWKELERVAISYISLFELLEFEKQLHKTTPAFLGKAASAVHNYHHFKNSTQFCHFTMHTKDWIKYSRERYLKKDAAIFPPKGSPSSKEEAEELLQELSFFCDVGKLSSHYAKLSKVKEDLAYDKHLTFTLNPAPIDGITPSTEVNPKTAYTDEQTDSTNSMLIEDSSSEAAVQCCLPVPTISSSRLPLDKKLNAVHEADYSPTSCNSTQVGTLSDLLAAAEYIEGKRNDMHANNSASRSACTSNNLKLQSVSSLLDCKQEYFSETLETNTASFLHESLNLGDENVGSKAGNIRETSTLEPSPLSIHKKIEKLDEQTSGDKIKLQQEKNIQNLANMMLDLKEEIIFGTDSRQLNSIPDPSALLKKIDEPFDMDIVFCEESGNPAPMDRTTPSTDVNPKNVYAEAQTDSTDTTLIEDSSSDAGAQCCLPVPIFSSSRFPRNEKLNAIYEADYSPTSCNSAQDGILSVLLAAVEYIEEKRNDMHANNGASRSACTSNNLKMQSVSSLLDCKQEYFSETIETDTASSLHESLNLGDEHIGSNAGNIPETSTLEPSPLSIHKKIEKLDEQTSEDKIKLQQEKNIQNLANMMLDQKEEIISGTDSIQLNSIPDPSALLKKIDEPLDMDVVFYEESGQQQRKNNIPSSFNTIYSVSDNECLRNMTDEDYSKTNYKSSGYKCAEKTIEGLSGHKTDQSTLETCDVLQENASISKEVESSNTVGAYNKKKKRKKAKPKKPIQPPERESNDVQDLLRMILVLGDKNGINYVCSTLQGADNAES